MKLGEHAHSITNRQQCARQDKKNAGLSTGVRGGCPGCRDVTTRSERTTLAPRRRWPLPLPTLYVI
jgi:hypothetical protein